jgi:hypothetical protein
MPTLGTQTISSSYAQLLKTFTTGGLDGTLQVVTDGDNTSSALSLSTTGVQSTGSFTVSSNSSLLGPVTFGSNITASTGTATIGTLSASTATIGTATIGSLTGTTGSLSGIFTAGSFRVGGGSTLTSMTYTTSAFTGSTISDINTVTNGSNISTGTFAFTGIGISDIILGSLTSLAGATGGTPGGLLLSFRTEATNVARYTILNCSSNTASTVGTGIIQVTAFRYIL